MSNDPTGKRALFSGHLAEDLAADGKEALFSGRDSGPGPIVVSCSRCGDDTHLSATDAARRMLALSLWLPGRRYSRRLRCPSCGRRTWVNVSIDRALPENRRE